MQQTVNTNYDTESPKFSALGNVKITANQIQR